MRLQRNYYEVMGLARNATSDDIRKKYHDLVRKFHPDRAEDKDFATRLFKQINLAYGTLIEPVRRAIYDAGLEHDDRACDSQAPNREKAPASGQFIVEAQPIHRPPVTSSEASSHLQRQQQKPIPTQACAPQQPVQRTPAPKPMWTRRFFGWHGRV